MYMFKLKSLDFKINKTKISEEIGISRPYLTDILNSKKSCTKVVAFCITKYLNKDAEINEYFYKKGE